MLRVEIGNKVLLLDESSRDLRQTPLAVGGIIVVLIIVDQHRLDSEWSGRVRVGLQLYQ